ncbi:Os10g0467850 [Oryza sativa Japonica Group]|uniref:Os10g0467850 protein n=1 Tax=Oryza sativa subsp. japonica TaxID=39947 RepID=A0A0N7KRX4_ORYSJ|nr:hypothetical protein EE612_051747 [Oryza sativa]BAT11226.1 Os10g0467850 [Oryza sativa Japonica Group]
MNKSKYSIQQESSIRSSLLQNAETQRSSSSSSARDPAWLEDGALGLGDEGVDPDPDEGEDGGEEDGPEHDNGGRPVLPPHEPLEEGVEVEDDPEGEEELPEQRAPRPVPVVHGVRHAGDDPHHVDDDQRRRRHQQRRPLEQVELAERVGLVGGGLGRHREVGVHAAEHLEEALEHGEQVRRHAADHPELLVPPPVLDAHPAPPQLQHPRRDDRQEKRYEPYARQIVKRGDDELAGEEADGGDGAVGEEGNGGEGVDDGVGVGEALEPLEAAAIGVPERAMAAHEDLDGAERPPEHLVQTIRQVDGRRPLECRPRRRAVHRLPPTAMHLEPR